jgi:preprotein translocase subunit SecY
MNGEEKPEFITKISKYLPAVTKPLYKQSFNTRLKWTGIALLAFLVLSNITVFGVSPQANEQFRFLEIVLGSKFGSLMTLGIGPIVTAGIILQLLVGSKIINWDTTKSEGRQKFQTWNKVLAVAFAFVEAIAYVLAGALGADILASGPLLVVFVIVQLAAGGIIVILLDEIVSKWGFGSGVSLFIVAGVTGQILIRAFSPLAVCQVGNSVTPCWPSAGNVPSGLLWSALTSLFSGVYINALVSFLPLIFTVIVFLVVVYAQNISVEIPLTFGGLRGFGRSWSLKLFYTSNIPVILMAALLANFQLMGRIGLQPTPEGLSCSFLGCFNQQGNPVSGVVYYLSSPRNLIGDAITGVMTSSEILRALIYLAVLSIGAMVFSVFWVSTSGMDAKSVSEQLESTGMQIPGYRRDPRIIESVLNRYIPALTLLGGLAIGLLAAFADFTGALGTGTGILLTVMILYNYYEELSAQPLEEAHPLVRKVLGE